MERIDISKYDDINIKSLNLTLTSNNTLSFLEEKFNFSILECLTPQIENVNYSKNSISTNSAVLRNFKLPENLKNIYHELIFDFQYRNSSKVENFKQFEKFENYEISIEPSDKSQLIINLNNLSYANFYYEFKIRAKSKTSKNIENRWSNYEFVTIKTKPKAPEMIPKLCDNCFNIMQNGNVMLYWTEVPECFHNADNFVYLIRVWDENNSKLIENSTNKTQYLIKKEFLHRNLRLKLQSSNAEGISLESAEIMMPNLLNISTKNYPKVYKQLIQKDGKSFYEITWNFNKTYNDKFILLWCNQKTDLLNQCDDSIQFINLSMNTTKYIMESRNDSHKIMLFGIAENSKQNRHGFVWTSCTASNSNGKFKLFNFKFVKQINILNLLFL